MSSFVATQQSERKPAAFTYLLGFIFVLFIGILVFVYIVTKKSNPILLDEHGKPISQSEPASRTH